MDRETGNWAEGFVLDLDWEKNWELCSKIWLRCELGAVFSQNCEVCSNIGLEDELNTLFWHWLVAELRAWFSNCMNLVISIGYGAELGWRLLLYNWAEIWAGSYVLKLDRDTRNWAENFVQKMGWEVSWEHCSGAGLGVELRALSWHWIGKWAKYIALKLTCSWARNFVLGKMSWELCSESWAGSFVLELDWETFVLELEWELSWKICPQIGLRAELGALFHNYTGRLGTELGAT